MSGSDPELDAMSAVSGALRPLDADAQGRVLRWAAERFGVTAPDATRTRPKQEEVAGGGEDESPADSQFSHFAELFAAGNPTSEADKALFAAYWVQVFQGKDDWFSQGLNAELKNLGHAIGNITRALKANIDARPQRIIQLKKSGGSRQSKKTYKVTGEGIKYVQAMLNAGAT